MAAALADIYVATTHLGSYASKKPPTKNLGCEARAVDPDSGGAQVDDAGDNAGAGDGPMSGGSGAEAADGSELGGPTGTSSMSENQPG